MNPRLQALLPYLRPTTLAAIVADLRNEYADNGDPLADFMGETTTDALAGIVGEADAQRMIEKELEQIP